MMTTWNWHKHLLTMTINCLFPLDGKASSLWWLPLRQEQRTIWWLYYNIFKRPSGVAIFSICNLSAYFHKLSSMQANFVLLFFIGHGHVHILDDIPSNIIYTVVDLCIYWSGLLTTLTTDGFRLTTFVW